MTDHQVDAGSSTPVSSTSPRPSHDGWDVDAIIACLSRVDGHLRSSPGLRGPQRGGVRHAHVMLTMLLCATDTTDAGQAKRKLALLGHVWAQWSEGRTSPESLEQRLLSVAMDHERRRWGVAMDETCSCFDHEFFFCDRDAWEPPHAELLAPPSEGDARLYRAVHRGHAMLSELLARLRRPEGLSEEPLSCWEPDLATTYLLWLLKEVCRPVYSNIDHRMKVSEIRRMLVGAGDSLGSACLAMIVASEEFDRTMLQSQVGSG